MEDLLALLQTDWLTLWENGNWFEATFGPLSQQLTRPAVVLLLGGPFTLALWMQTEQITVPAVILALFMGLFLTGAPAGATIVGYLIVVAGTLVAYRSIFGDG